MGNDEKKLQENVLMKLWVFSAILGAYLIIKYIRS